ncbi:hypothetical protein [Bacillus toyonensis]|uniref:hypothetical protein n=1 Tax=Bacillus toyonensis TaxID=155322 RepID=UPI000BECCBC1|nr:hypothetical protein [Bacillus toyonensis]PED58962.1 hypothetical protein CON89_23210 [Bacillus toyonensis]PEJ91424.1 hypothetical protein CN687_19950 [Bacillus toyonensis]PGC99076.1 hypothetical protein COM26_05965 [Bacillus toyonensis]PGD74316.1 hypothetical protein COM36_28755 [Bacillus toyonensis]PGE84621.1 hypothetical protein COM75_29840 [Bacillus toyonensis]
MFTLNSEKLNIKWVSLSATILSSSKYGQEFDRAKILHEIALESPLVEDETFYIPAKDKPIDTRLNFPDGNITNFAGQRFKDIQDELERFSQAVKDGNAEVMEELYQMLKSTTLLAPVVFKQGTQVLTFEYELALYPNDENTFELSLWAPMPTFNVITQGKVVTTIQIPGQEQFGATILEAEGYIPDADGNPTEQTVSKNLDQNYGLRHIVGWSWQNDPLFKVRYQYQA